MRKVTGYELGTQVWLERPPEKKGPPSAKRFQPVVNKAIKPRGGMWTSSPHPRHPSHWVDWMVGEEFHGSEPVRMWKLEPRPNAMLLEVDTYADLEEIVERYPHDPYAKMPSDFPRWPELQPDFEAITQDYAGFHLTEEGQWATRLTTPLHLYGWDCESTLWLKWSFDWVRKDGVWQPPPKTDRYSEEEVDV